MTLSERYEQLKAMLEEDPQDSFLRYAIAMEHRKAGQLEESIQGMQSLQADTPPYVPAFLMAAQQQVELDRIEEARTTLRVGIEQARAQGEAHAASEMAELLMQLGSAGE